MPERHWTRQQQLLALRLYMQLPFGRLHGREALADRAGLHRTYVGSIERSERNVTLDNIERLAHALNVQAAELLQARRGSR